MRYAFVNSSGIRGCEIARCRKIAAHTLSSAVRVITFELNAAAYVNEIYAAAEAPEDNFLLVFTETLSAYIMIADINLPAASIQKLYQTHVKAVVNERTLAAFLENPRTWGTISSLLRNRRPIPPKWMLQEPILPNIIRRISPWNRWLNLYP